MVIFLFVLLFNSASLHSSIPLSIKQASFKYTSKLPKVYLSKSIHQSEFHGHSSVSQVSWVSFAATILIASTLVAYPFLTGFLLTLPLSLRTSRSQLYSNSTLYENKYTPFSNISSYHTLNYYVKYIHTHSPTPPQTLNQKCERFRKTLKSDKEPNNRSFTK